MNNCSIFVKKMRKQYGLTQEQLAEKSGVGLRFLRELEGGKPTLRMDKVNSVLAMFDAELGVVKRDNTVELLGKPGYTIR